MGSWQDSRTVTGQTWGVVKQNPYMLLFPVAAGLVSIVVVLAVGATGLGFLGVTELEKQVTSDGALSTRTEVVGIVVLVLAAYLGTLITQVCMGGLVKCADDEMHGTDSSFGAGLGAALGRLPALMGWALIQTLVGWILSAIRGNGSDGNIVVTILRLLLSTLAAVAWSVISFFVLPLIMLRGKGPIEAIKESVAMIRATWGMQIAGGIRIGALIGLLGVLPGIIAMVGGGFLIATDKTAMGVPLAALGVIVLVLAQVLVSALRAVFAVALLHYAEGGEAIGPYDAAELRAAVKVKA